MNISEKLEEKQNALLTFLREHAPFAVAFSGGVDSTYLLAMAKRAVDGQVMAYFADGPMVPASEKQEALSLAAQIGVRLNVLEADVLAIPEFAGNVRERCYYCKHCLFGLIREAAAKDGIKTIMDGSNLDDESDFRPGRKALQELSVLSPLKEVQLHKEEIRSLSGEARLSTAHKQAMACLATRIPMGEEITAEKLRRVEFGEELLKLLGLTQYRLRLPHEDTARIECSPKEMPLLLENREELLRRLRELGITRVTLDLDGYHMGGGNG